MNCIRIAFRHQKRRALRVFPELLGLDRASLTNFDSILWLLYIYQVYYTQNGRRRTACHEGHIRLAVLGQGRFRPQTITGPGAKDSPVRADVERCKVDDQARQAMDPARLIVRERFC